VEHRLRVFDKRGDPLAEINASVNCSWAQGDIGSLEFTISRDDANCTRENLEFGNYVLWESEFLQPWGGIIWPPRDWGRGTVTVHALAGEFWFKRKWVNIAEQTGMPKNALHGIGSAIFTKVIEIGESVGGGRIELGRLTGEGPYTKIEHSAQVSYDALQELAGRVQQEWWLEPDTDSENRIVFFANWEVRRGKEKNFDLVEGKNFELVGMATESGELINRVLVFGEGESWLPYAFAADKNSQFLYGATMRSEYMTEANQETLEARAEEWLKEAAHPTIRFPATIYGDEAFRNIRLGDSFNIVMENVGFTQRGVQMKARITAMQYDSAANVLKAIFEQAPQADENE